MNKYIEAVKQFKLEGALQSVLEAVASFSDNETGEAFPSYKTIAEKAGVARSTAQTCIDKLLEIGRLTKAGTRQTPRGFVNVFRVVIDPTGTVPGTLPIHPTDSQYRHSTGSPTVPAIGIVNGVGLTVPAGTELELTQVVVTNNNLSSSSEPKTVGTVPKSLVDTLSKCLGKTDSRWKAEADGYDWAGYDAQEMEAALLFAFSGNFWPTRIHHMGNVIKHIDTLLEQYRGKNKPMIPFIEKIREPHVDNERHCWCCGGPYPIWNPSTGPYCSVACDEKMSS